MERNIMDLEQKYKLLEKAYEDAVLELNQLRHYAELTSKKNDELIEALRKEACKKVAGSK